MAFITGNLADAKTAVVKQVRIDFHLKNGNTTYNLSLVPAFSVSTQSDDYGDFNISLVAGLFEVTFAGRHLMYICVPDDPAGVYRITDIICSAAGDLETVFQTVPPYGLNYQFSTTDLYLRNLTNGYYHKVSLVTDGDVMFTFDASPATFTRASTVAITGGNYQFYSDLTFRLKNTTSGLFHSIRSEGQPVFDILYITPTGGASSPSSSTFSSGVNARFRDRLWQLQNPTTGRWTTPFLTGALGEESLTLFPGYGL